MKYKLYPMLTWQAGSMMSGKFAVVNRIIIQYIELPSESKYMSCSNIPLNKQNPSIEKKNTYRKMSTNIAKDKYRSLPAVQILDLIYEKKMMTTIGRTKFDTRLSSMNMNDSTASTTEITASAIKVYVLYVAFLLYALHLLLKSLKKMKNPMHKMSSTPVIIGFNLYMCE